MIDVKSERRKDKSLTDSKGRKVLEDARIDHMQRGRRLRQNKAVGTGSGACET